jgi:hypothetical protein
MEKFNGLYDDIILESKKDVNHLHEFIEKRKAGAKKIQKSSEEKGGASKLTAIHFAAKEKPYNQALNIKTKETFDKTIKEKSDKLVSKLREWHNMSQNEFQTVMGQLEAYGELYIMSTKPNSIKID